jgi:putative Mg2+ transporter-C (MgtC) family protein
MDVPWELKVAGEVAFAMVLGGLIGMEREVANKPAGIRTHMLVAGAAALLVGLGHALIDEFRMHANSDALRLQTDPVRIVEAIVTGVSFLGAGTIFRRSHEETVEGLTTAACLLVCAAIGISVAVQRFVLAAIVTALAFFVLRGVKAVELWFARRRRPEGD